MPVFPQEMVGDGPYPLEAQLAFEVYEKLELTLFDHWLFRQVDVPYSIFIHVFEVCIGWEKYGIFMGRYIVGIHFGTWIIL